MTLPVDQLIRLALAEDLGLAGDITSIATIPPDHTSRVVMRARKPGVLSGASLARDVFLICDPELRVETVAMDGRDISAGEDLMMITGLTRPLLAAERVALNLIARFSGIATLTRRYVEAVAGTSTQIVCTRKTTPLWRAQEKAAVRHGGGVNHRFGLFDAVLIKDNHIAACGGDPVLALTRARATVGHMVTIEIEVDSLDQFRALLPHRPDIVLLDNFLLDDLAAAVILANGSVVLEASGGVTLESVRSVAQTGVNLISVGALTHSAPILDIGLDAV